MVSSSSLASSTPSQLTRSGRIAQVVERFEAGAFERLGQATGELTVVPLD